MSLQTILVPVVESRRRFASHIFSACLLASIFLWSGAASSTFAQTNCSTASFGEPMLHNAGSVRSLVVADFDRDGNPDIAAGTNATFGGYSMLFGDGSGQFPITTGIFSLGRFTVSLAAGDFNGNGRPDLVAANGGSFSNFNSSGNASVSLDPPFSFANEVRLIWDDPNAPSVSTSVAVGDFNADSKLDVVVTNSTHNAVYVALGDGAGGFGNYKTFSSGGVQPVFVKVGEFNGDGKLDLAVANATSSPGNVAILLGDGTGSFGTPTTYVVGSKPVSIASGDFNGDGKLDLAVANNGSQNISILIGNGAGGFAPATNVSSGGSLPTSLAAADLSGDGKLDLVVVNGQEATAVILNGDGAGNFTFSARYNSGAPDPKFVTANDLNGDGRPDLVIGHETSRRVSVLLNTCAAAETAALSFGAGRYAVYENAGAATITVQRTGLLTSAVTVNYQIVETTGTAGSDYTEISGTLNFASGETTKTITFPILNDSEVEENELVVLQLKAPTGGAILGIPAFTVVTILDDDSCSYYLNIVERVASPAGETLTVNVTAREGCSWTAASNSGFINVTSGASGTGSGSVVLDISANSSGFSRTGTVTIAGQTFTVRQTTIGGESPTLIFSSSSAQVNENAGRVTINITRTGDVSAPATVDYRTSDTDTFSIGCADNTNNKNGAFARCDFTTTVGRLEFAAGEAQKTLTVPIVDDGHVEDVESFQVVFSNLTGTITGSTATTTINIFDNDEANTPNPVTTSITFFVRQHYLDFLSREPEPSEPWSAVLMRCPNINTGPAVDTDCDRIATSRAFFESPEFNLKAIYVFRFYKLAFNRLPEYREIVSDMSFVAGATAEEVYARKAQLANLFVARQEFTNTYGAMSNAQFVSALLARYQLTQIVTPDPAQPDGATKVTLTNTELTNRLNANTLTRAQVFRAIADSDQVQALEFEKAFVAMQYYGYLRRTPEPAGYEANLAALQRGTSRREMINGFLNSAEYRLRFGRLN